MKKVYIIHGWGAEPHHDWFPWLAAELKKLGYQVIVPTMPDTDEPVISRWVESLADIVGRPNHETFFVGHSIGVQAILRYLETIKTPVGGAVFVAGWFNLDNLEDEEAEDIARPWLETPINMEKVKKNLPRSSLIISDNDPFGCFEENKQKFAELGSKIIVLSGAGHIGKSDGFTKLPPVIDELAGF
ncbi:MAG: alpha/beta fold hydrolase [Candidatus Paceibacterota bacterium]